MILSWYLFYLVALDKIIYGVEMELKIPTIEPQTASQYLQYFLIILQSIQVRLYKYHGQDHGQTLGMHCYTKCSRPLCALDV